MFDPEKYRKALRFATIAHGNQKIPSTDLPYNVHIVNVAMEVTVALFRESGIDADLAVQCALLHDTIEDTEVIYDELKKEFGEDAANGVMALTKNKALPKNQQMTDSLSRIKLQPKEISIVKLADRITNLSSPPPKHWSQEKTQRYCYEAKLIADTLGEASDYLEKRLRDKIQMFNTKE